MILSRKFALATLIILLYSGFSLHAQQLSTFYYNESWESCKRTEATYYRVVQLDKVGNPVGLVHDYYKSGKLQFCGKMLGLQPVVLDSVCTWYDENGVVEMRCAYAKGKRNGVQDRYYTTGQISTEITFRNDTPVTDYKLFYGSGKLEGVRHYLVPGDTVPFEEYFQSGELKGKGLYKRGANVPWDDTLISSIQYLDTGRLDYDITENPHLHGPGKSQSYRNGKLVAEQHSLNGAANGWQAWYDKKGQPTFRAFYRNGKIDNVKEQFVDGQLTVHEEYTNFEPSGTWFNYYSGGKLAAKHIYHHDTIETWRYYNDGQLQLHDFTWHGGQIKRREDYYPNGEIQQIKVYSPQVEHLNGVLIDSSFYTGHRIKYVATLFENPKYGKDDAFSNISFDSLGHITNYRPPVNERIYPVKDNLACLWGFKKYDGTWAIRPKYTLVDSHGNYFLVWEGGRCGLISIAADSVLPCAYTAIEVVTFFKSDNPPAILLEKGKLKLPGGYHYDKNDLSKTDFYFVTLDTLHGVLTSHGDTVLPVVCNAVSHDVRDSTITYKKGRTQSIIKLPFNRRVEFAGMIVEPTGINDLYEFTHRDHWPEGYGVWAGHPEIGLITSSGRIVLADTFNYVNLGLIKKGVIGFGSYGFGLMDTGGRVLLEPKYPPAKKPYAFELFYQAGLLPLVNGKWMGLYDSKGEQVLPFKYKDISLPTYNRELEVTDEKGKIGVYSISRKNFVLPCQFDTIVPYSIYQGHSVYMCRKDGVYGLYNDTGNLMGSTWPYYSVLDVSTATFLFTDGRVIVQASGTGNTSSLYFPTNLPGGARIGNFTTPTGNNTSCIFNANNNVIYMGNASDVSPMPNGNIFMKDSLGKVRLIDILGNKVLDLSGWAHLSDPIAQDWMVASTGTGKYGIINETGKLIIDTAYNSIWVAVADDKFEPPVFWVRDVHAPIDSTAVMTQDGGETEANFGPLVDGWTALDYNGHAIISTACKLPAAFKNNVVVVETDHGVGAFDDKGNTLFKDTFGGIQALDADLFLIQQNGLYGVAHKNGDWLTPVKWQKINLISDDHIVVSQNDKLVVLNYNADTLVPPDYNAFIFSDSDYNDWFRSGYANSTGDDQGNYISEGLDDENGAKYPLLNKVIENYFWYKYLTSTSFTANAPGPETITYGNLYGGNTASQWDEVMPGQNESTNTLVDFTPHTFSVETMNSSCYRGGCQYDFEYRNFLVEKHTLISLTIDSVLNTAGGNATSINEIFKKQVAVDEDLHLNCQNAESFFETFKENFSIGKTGLTFYLVENENTYTAPPTDAPTVIIPYGKLEKYIKPEVGKWIYGGK